MARNLRVSDMSPWTLSASRRGHPYPPAQIARFHQDPSPKSPAFFHSEG